MQIEDGTVIKARSLAERSFNATSFSLLNFYLQTPCNFAATLLFLHESKTQIENTLKRDYNLVFPDFLTSHFPIAGEFGISVPGIPRPDIYIYTHIIYIYIYIYVYIIYILYFVSRPVSGHSRPHQPGHQQRHRSAQLHCCDSARSDPIREKRGSLRAEKSLFLQQFVYYQCSVQYIYNIYTYTYTYIYR